MEIKKGDKVRIKSWEEMEAEFGLDYDGDIDCAAYFTKAMREFCGEVLTVAELDYYDYGWFYVTATKEFYFSTDMVAEVISEEI